MSDARNLLDTDTDLALRESLSALLLNRCELTDVARAYDGDRSLTGPLWQALAADLGLAGLLIPETYGGAGATLREVGVAAETLARWVAPVPFLASSVIGTTVLLSSPELAGDLLRGLAAGERTVALLVPWSHTPEAALPSFTVDGGTVSGRATSVAGALDADTLLVAVEVAGGVEVYAVPADSADVTAVVSLDMSRPLADVTLESAAARLVVAAEDGRAALAAGLQAGAAVLPSELAGIADWCLTTTVAYLKERRQFARVVGGFQAIKHRLAALYIQVDSASAAARFAAASYAEGAEDTAIAVATANAYCKDVAVLAAEETVQLHGGIGMTWEHPTHLFLKRAKADQIALGLPGHHRAQLADLVDVPA